MFRFHPLCVLILALSPCLAAALSSGQKDLNVKSFEQVWTTVRDQHWDPKLGGVDWQAAHDEFLPKVQKAETMAGVRSAMEGMLDRLGASHFGILPSDLYDGLHDESSLPGERGSPGMECSIVDRKALVRIVTPGSPAAVAGVKPGWIVSKVGTTDLDEAIAKLYASKTHHKELMAWALVRFQLQGNVNQAVAVSFIDGNGKTVQIPLGRTPDRGTPAGIGFLPPMPVWFESKRIGPDIGYIRFNQFLDPPRIMAQFAGAVDSCTDCKGIIIDLRGNTGGIGVMAMGMAGFFTDGSDRKLGTMIMRQAKLNFVINPRAHTYKGSLAILLDATSASTSEIFAGGLQDLKEARIFGTQSAGAALPSNIRKLPNGDAFQFAVANYISEGGKPLEGSGVTPDVRINQSREALLNGHDLVIDAAVDWIKGNHDQ